jgi:hypothetical protein
MSKKSPDDIHIIRSKRCTLQTFTTIYQRDALTKQSLDSSSLRIPALFSAQSGKVSFISFASSPMGLETACNFGDKWSYEK